MFTECGFGHIFTIVSSIQNGAQKVNVQYISLQL
jgi:hypothetical protein